MPIRSLFLLLVAMAPHLACGQPAGPGAEPHRGGEPDSLVAFRDVHLLTMAETGVQRHQTLVVRDGVIDAFGPVGNTVIPPGATLIAGDGRWLMPGLVDGHVHVRTEDLEAYPAHGVTSVRNMWGWPGLREIATRIDSGELAGPTIVSYSSGLDAPPEYWPYTQVVTTPGEGRAAVRRQASEGWSAIKIYRDLSRASFDAIVDEARTVGIPLAGHVPVRVGIDASLDAGLLSIEHLLGYGQALGGSYGAWDAPFDEAGMRELARRTREAGTWNCPTLEILRRNGRPGHGNRLRAVRVLHEEGAELLVGTDAGIGVTEPGASMVAEMRLWQKAGVPPMEILRDATADAARLLGSEGSFGVIEVGARADLILLREDPSRDVANLRHLEGVMVRGRWTEPGSS